MSILKPSTSEKPGVSRRSVWVILLASVILAACDNTLSSGESKNISPWGRIKINEIVWAMQSRRLNVILFEAYSTNMQYNSKWGYMIYKEDTGGKQSILIESVNSNRISIEYSEDGYLKNNSSVPFSLGQDLWNVIASIELNIEPKNSPTSW